jgi:hypothetical protein
VDIINKYKPTAFWSWNDKLEYKEIQRQKLNEFKEIIKTYESSARKPYAKAGANFGTELMDVNSMNEVQKSLREQHKAFKSLIEIINQDLTDLNKIKKDLYKEK